MGDRFTDRIRASEQFVRFARTEASTTAFVVSHARCERSRASHRLEWPAAREHRSGGPVFFPLLLAQPRRVHLRMGYTGDRVGTGERNAQADRRQAGSAQLKSGLKHALTVRMGLLIAGAITLLFGMLKAF